MTGQNYYISLKNFEKKICLKCPEDLSWDLEKLQHTRVNILDLKILQVFFKNRGN